MSDDHVHKADGDTHPYVLLVYHGDKSVERVFVTTSSPLEVGDTASMRKALAVSDVDVQDIFKVKIDDGKFFGGQDLVDWLCSRLREEMAFSGTVRKKIEEERLAASNAFDRLAENEKCMKKELRSKEKEREAADRRLTDTTEALRLQKELRMKSMLEQQKATKEMSRLQAEVSSLMERINLHADVTVSMEKECGALRSTVNMGRRVREVDDAELRRTLTEALKREEVMVRLKRRLHALETDRNEWNARMTRAQREANRLRAVLWSNGINATAAVASKAAATRVDSKAARRQRDNARRRDHKQKHPNRMLAPLEKTDKPGDGIEHRPVWPSSSRNLVGGDNCVPRLAAGLGRNVNTGDRDDWRPLKAGMVPKSVGAIGRGRRDPTSVPPSMSEIDDILNFADSL